MSNAKTAVKELSDDQKRQLAAFQDKLKTAQAKLAKLSKAKDSPEKADSIDRTKRHVDELQKEISILEKNESA